MLFRSRRFHGRISGFTIGTGSTLALLPAENATGNFVKVVQRLPVRLKLIERSGEPPLRAGMTASVSIYTKRKRSLTSMFGGIAVAIPQP